MSEMRLCPFCGRVPAYRNDGYASWFQCERCAARGPACEPGDDAVAAWDHRAPTPPGAEVEALMEGWVSKQYLRPGASVWVSPVKMYGDDEQVAVVRLAALTQLEES